MSVSSRIIDGAFIASIDNPPVNALSVGRRAAQALTDVIKNALADPSVELILVRAKSGAFNAVTSEKP